ncbi:MAG: cation:proton antiporter [Clostridia bacterium]|nr:cation:proton antiporter [Clostridia bacterium]
MEILFTLSVALFAGLLLSRLAKLCNLPAVTAYLIAGVLIGPFVLGAFGVEGLGFTGEVIHTEKFKIISDVALGFIAFSIGNEFRMNDLKQFGKTATIIGILQAVFTTVVVDVGLIALHFILGKELFPIEAAIILGAVASATAPAATLMVVKQYKARGPVTKTLLPVVALDDAVGLVLFAISFGVAKSIATIGDGLNPWQIVISTIVEPILEVILSIGLGALIGLIFTFIERFFHSRSKRLAVSVAFVLLTVAISMIKFSIPFGNSGVSMHVGFSSLLACMMLGTIFCNICDFSAELMDRLDRWTAPIYVLFFVISGAELNLGVFNIFKPGNWVFIVIGIVYIAFRCLGKYFGARTSATISKAEPNVKKYLGITLFPQAGVALGMANMVASETEIFQNNTPLIVLNIILFSVLIYEIVGPFLTKISLQKAGEIDRTKKVSNRIKHHDKTIPTTKI